MELFETKSDVSYNLCGLKEIFVLRTIKLFVGSHNSKINSNRGMLCALRDTYQCSSYMSLYYRNNYELSLFRIFGYQHLLFIISINQR
jgi:hypothetical protein